MVSNLLVMKVTQISWKEKDQGTLMVPRNTRYGGRISKRKHTGFIGQDSSEKQNQ